MTTRSLYAAINCAASIDGKIAFADGSFTPFGSADDRARMCEIRTHYDAVMCGANTVRITDTVLEAGGSKQSARVVISGRGTLSPAARIFEHHSGRGAPLVIVVSDAAPPEAIAKYRDRDAQVEVFTAPIRFAKVFERLASVYGTRRLLCEGGGFLNAALFAEELVDYLHVTVCPLVIGGVNSPTLCDGQGADSLAAACPLELQWFERRGAELFLGYAVKGRGGLPDS
jgi:riboflavin-specific deaminase-like protein